MTSNRFPPNAEEVNKHLLLESAISDAALGKKVPIEGFFRTTNRVIRSPQLSGDSVTLASSRDVEVIFAW